MAAKKKRTKTRLKKSSTHDLLKGFEYKGQPIQGVFKPEEGSTRYLRMNDGEFKRTNKEEVAALARIQGTKKYSQKFALAPPKTKLKMLKKSIQRAEKVHTPEQRRKRQQLYKHQQRLQRTKTAEVGDVGRWITVKKKGRYYRVPVPLQYTYWYEAYTRKQGNPKRFT